MCKRIKKKDRANVTSVSGYLFIYLLHSDKVGSGSS